MVLAGMVSSFFVTHDALNFQFIQMIIGIVIFTLIIFIIAFWPMLRDLFKRIIK